VISKINIFVSTRCVTIREKGNSKIKRKKTNHSSALIVSLFNLKNPIWKFGLGGTRVLCFWKYK
jgi:hypothetical protein